MDELLYEALDRYYHALELTGYMSKNHGFKLLVLSFYRDIILRDFQDFITSDDKYLIEKAINCMFGTDCVLPFPDYGQKTTLITGDNGKAITPPEC